MKKKCDIIIPVYKSPEWVKLCVYSIFKNTESELLNKVYLINDCDDELTCNCLKNLSQKYSNIEILNNKKNLGFIKSTNKGMQKSNADYVLLLNTDCIISKNTIGKLMAHMEKDEKIGLICPISSNAANLTLEMFEGYTYSQMNNLLEKKFKGKTFDACTVVGNCLMISRKCINKIGYLDEIYGTGYGEETDYQFKAMAAGFTAKVAIDTYVFHKAEVSFGTSKEKQEKLDKNRKIFFDRWGKEYNTLMDLYKKNDPIKYIMSKLTEDDKKVNFEFLIYLIGFSQNAGGVHMTVDMVNYLTINNFECNVLYGFSNGYDEIMLFNPIQVNEVDNYKFKKIVSTIYSSTYFTKELSNKYNVPLIYYAQGYEPYFENGNDYGVAELSYKLPDDILTISNYLKKRYYETFNVDSYVISNGINYDLLHKVNHSKDLKVITIVLRNNSLKGDFILLDILKIILNSYEGLEINVLYNNKYIEFPFDYFNNNKINKYLGPFSRKEIASILQQSDLYIDASLTEGFGLMALEAMAAGNVVVVSDSGGINEYIKDGINGYIIKEVNDVNAYMQKIDALINNNSCYLKIKENITKNLSSFDYDNKVEEFIVYFEKEVQRKNVKLNDEEKDLYNKVLDNRFKVSVDNKPKNLLYKICRKFPKGFRIHIKKIVQRLYEFTNER